MNHIVAMPLYGIIFDTIRKDIDRAMDKKDEIILQQLDVIREMTARNLRHVGEDIWGPANKIRTETGKTNKTDDIKDANAMDIRNIKPSSDKTRTVTSSARRNENDGIINPAKPGGNANGNGNTAASTGASDPKAEPSEPAKKEDIKDLKTELDSYIGLGAVKDEVHDLINMVTVWKMRREHELPAPDLSLHMVFSGNPGTGKTMIARFMARVYHALGILSKGQLVEVDRSGLVAGYVGQTAIKTASVIEKAKGGVLFIDEAYSLTSGKADNDFGGEAIETLLKAMEDNRDDLIVIVAGYTDLMEDFIASNPGLQSRFNRYLYFDNYTTDEMIKIFELQCKKNFYILEGEAEKDSKKAPDSTAASAENKEPQNTKADGAAPVEGEARKALRTCIEDARRDEDFGNARGVRNLFERILIEQANRIASESEITRESLMTIKAGDIKAAQQSV